MSTANIIRNDLQFNYDQHAWCLLVGFEMGRLEIIFNNHNFDEKLNLISSQAQDEIVNNIKPILSAKGITLHDELPDYQAMNKALMRDIELVSGRFFSFYMIGVAAFRVSAASDAIEYKNTFLETARSCIQSIPIQYLEDKDSFFLALCSNNFYKVIHLADFLTSLNTLQGTEVTTSGKKDSIMIQNNLQFDYDQHAWCVFVGFQMGRLEGIFNNHNFDAELNKLLMNAQLEIIEEIKPILMSKGITLHDELPDYQAMNRALIRDLELASGRFLSFYMIGMAVLRISMADASSGKYYAEMLALAKSCIESIPSQYLIDKELMFEKLLEHKFRKTVEVTDFLTAISTKKKLYTEKYSMNYQDFQILVTVDHKIRASSEQGDEWGELQLNMSEIKLALNLIEKNQIDADLLKMVGSKLYQALFPNKVHGHWRATKAGAEAARSGTRLRLLFESPELAALPWEFLYDEDTNTFIANDTQTALSRYLDVPQSKRAIGSTSHPLKILLVISSPKNLPKLDTTDEEALILDALAEYINTGTIELDVVHEATIRNLTQQLRTKSYNVFHFIGHGDFENDKGMMALVETDGRARMLDEEAFANFFLGNQSIGLAVLNSCRGASLSSYRAMTGVAPNLVRRGLPAVIAMQYSILDTTAKQFADEFYRTLALGWPVDAALQTTRNAISITVGTDHRDFATPVLYMRAKDGMILSKS